MRDPVVADKRSATRLHAISQRAIVDYLRRGLARPAVGSSLAGLGVRTRRAALLVTTRTRAGAPRRGRPARPGRRRSHAPACA
jgi:hypothetical protein